VRTVTGQYFVKRAPEALTAIGTDAAKRAQFWNALTAALQPFGLPKPA
jgi:hypothetical protein